MKAADQFHVGIVAEDFDGLLAQLSDLFGYRWSEEVGGPMPVRFPAGEAETDLRCVYSTVAPRVEVVRSIPGTLWVPDAGSGIHHLGYWSDDVAADSAALAERGLPMEAAGTRPDGTPYWVYHRNHAGPRIELVSRELQPALEQLWGGGPPA